MNTTVKRMMTGSPAVVLAAAGLLVAARALAGNAADVTFHGTLIEAPPCVINAGKPVVVDFGNEVMTTRIDGSAYRQRIPVDLDCSAALSSKQKLRITGTPAGFDALALSGGSAQAGFGIALYEGSGRYTPGEWLPFTDPAVPELYAVPVKQDGVTLTGGAFSILASLVVDYQ